jgi:hypothetical protein
VDFQVGGRGAERPGSQAAGQAIRQGEATWRDAQAGSDQLVQEGKSARSMRGDQPHAVPRHVFHQVLPEVDVASLRQQLRATDLL